MKRIVAVEPDLRKVFRTFRHGAVRFVGGLDDAVGGTFDVVTLIDVLYTIPKPAWDPLLSRAAARLGRGGTLLIKEQDPAERLKNGWNRIQEWIAQKVLRVTLAHDFAYETREEMTARLRRHGFATVEVHPIGGGYPHPHLLYVARREEGDAESAGRLGPR